MKLLGTVPDEQVVMRTGRTVNAIRLKRGKLGIPDPGRDGWTAAEVALLVTAPDAEVTAVRLPEIVAALAAEMGAGMAP